jgi:hypothetical protein
VLQGRLTAAFVAASALATTAVLAACGGSDDVNAIRENVVEPGVTAIEEGGSADRAACQIDASALRTALESYELLQGEPAVDEAALVEAGFLRSESELWDVVDGRLAAVDPGCSDVAAETEAPEIVTSTSIPSIDEVLAALSDEEVEALGGPDCAREVAQIYAAGERFVAETGEAPDDLDALVDGGYLAARPELWTFVDGELVPADGSDCTAFTDE